MALIFLLFAAFNVALGIGLALWGHSCALRQGGGANEGSGACEPETPAERLAAKRVPTLEGALTTAEPTPLDELTAEAQSPAPRSLQAEEIPTAWVEQLRAEALVCRTVVEASAEVLKLEVAKYREQLLDLDAEVRKLENDPDELRLRAKRLAALNDSWLARQAEATRFLKEQAAEPGLLAEISAKLEHVLLEQTSQIETTDSNLIMFASEGADESLAPRIRDELGRLVDLAHALRDRMQETLLAIMRAEGRIPQLNKQFRTDGLTGLVNTAGIEALVHSWRAQEAGGQRLASLVLIDIDHLARGNTRHGARTCDLLLRALASNLAEQLRKERGFDVAARLAGNSFALFLGDTGPRGATTVAERVRQTLAVTTFTQGETTLEISVSCGVAELGATDELSDVCERLHKAVREAKNNGRNRTYLDEGYGPQPIEPPDFQVRGRIVPLSK